ncbi:MAG TPA: hypothetical protein PLM75_12345, partial [bacterium]|nr:hypothetical protein [bacterium]
ISIKSKHFAILLRINLAAEIIKTANDFIFHLLIFYNFFEGFFLNFFRYKSNILYKFRTIKRT